MYRSSHSQDWANVEVLVKLRKQTGNIFERKGGEGKY